MGPFGDWKFVSSLKNKLLQLKNLLGRATQASREERSVKLSKTNPGPRTIPRFKI